MSTVPLVTKTFIRQGASLARGTTIDEYLSEKDCKVLYSGWQKNWPEPLEFHGGITAITCEMVLEVPEKEFVKSIGKAVGTRIYDVARRNAGR